MRHGHRPGPGGFVIVDKPGAMTSHDVVARIRKLAGTRKVGHAGTLDPMATGVLIVGIERATRLLGYLSSGDKAYAATIRLGVATDTDDATGTAIASADASGIGDADIDVGVSALTGRIAQVPSTVSAIKVAGKRAYDLARAGADVQLTAREVTVSRFAVLARRRDGRTVDLDVEVDCSTGTYVRALARDLGGALGVGGHLTALRRTRVGPFGARTARTLEQLAGELTIVPLGDAARATFPHRAVDAEAARILVHGGWLPAEIAAAPDCSGPSAVFGPAGEFLALVEVTGRRAKPIAVFGDT